MVEEVQKNDEMERKCRTRTNKYFEIANSDVHIFTFLPLAPSEMYNRWQLLSAEIAEMR